MTDIRAKISQQETLFLLLDGPHRMRKERTIRGRGRTENYGRYGCIDDKVSVVIGARCEISKNFSEGLAAVKIDGRHGYMDHMGKYARREE